MRRTAAVKLAVETYVIRNGILVSLGVDTKMVVGQTETVVYRISNKTDFTAKMGLTFAGGAHTIRPSLTGGNALMSDGRTGAVLCYETASIKNDGHCAWHNLTIEPHRFLEVQYQVTWADSDDDVQVYLLPEHPNYVHLESVAETQGVKMPNALVPNGVNPDDGPAVAAPVIVAGGPVVSPTGTPPAAPPAP